MENGKKSIDKLAEVVSKMNSKIKDVILVINPESLPDLKFIKTQKRIGSGGIATNKYSNKWFSLKKGNALFKDHSKHHDYFFAWNEMICSKLCKQINLPCADYDFAKMKNSIGTVSYNFLKNDEWLVDGDYFLTLYFPFHSYNTFLDYKSVFYPNNLKLQERFSYNSEEILFGLYKILLFDFLTKQCDRHAGNIGFVCNDIGDTIEIRLAPLFDNEMSFGDLDILKCNDEFKQTHNIKNVYNFHFDPGFYVSSTKFDKSEKSLQYAVDLMYLTNSNPTYKEYYNFVMQKLNVIKCFKEFEKQGHTISLGMKYWYLNVINNQKDLLKQAENIVANDISQTQNNNDEMQR